MSDQKMATYEEGLEEGVQIGRDEGEADGYQRGLLDGNTHKIADARWSAALGRRATAPFESPWDDNPSWVQRLYSLPSDAEPRR